MPNGSELQIVERDMQGRRKESRARGPTGAKGHLLL